MATDSFTSTVSLRYKHGLVGYAIYTRLVERINASKDKRLAYNKDEILWDLREQGIEDVLDSVVNDCDLFELVDGYIIDAENYATMKKNEKKAAISKARSEAGKKSAKARGFTLKEDKSPLLCEEEKVDATPVVIEEEEYGTEQDVDSISVSPTQGGNVVNPNGIEPVRKIIPPEERKVFKIQSCYAQSAQSTWNNKTPQGAYYANPDEGMGVDPQWQEAYDKMCKVRDVWNEEFEGTRRLVHWLTPPQEDWFLFQKIWSDYSLDDFRDAFKECRKDKNYSWNIRNVFKPSNMQMLLGRADLKKDSMPKNEREVYEAVEASGGLW